MHLTVHGRSGPADKIAAYLAAAFETSDAQIIAHALGVAARAKGMSQVAEEAGCAREQLYRSLSKKGNPTLKTVLAILSALAVRNEPEKQISKKRPSNTKPSSAKAR